MRNPVSNNYLSIDIGGTNVKYGILDNSGNLKFHKSVVTPHNKRDLLSALNIIVKTYLSDIKGVGISVPGKINTESGTVHYGGSLPFLDKISLKDELEKKFGIPTAVENDGKAGALAELWLGSLRNVDDGAIIILGTGVGGGIILHHQLVHGTNFQAGELSYMNLDPKSVDQSGLIGFSGSATKMVETCANILGLEDKHNGIAVFKEINKGTNPKIMKIFKDYCDVISTLILNIQSVLDLNTFAISGGISAQSIVVGEINRSYSKLMINNPLLCSQMKAPQIVQAKFRNDANLYGALYNWFLQNDRSIFKTA